MFRAANYYRAADFFLHGNPQDPRILETWKNTTACFDLASSLLDVPAERILIDGGEFHIPTILYRPSADSPVQLCFSAMVSREARKRGCTP
jgi:hypothetical protein